MASQKYRQTHRHTDSRQAEQHEGKHTDKAESEMGSQKNRLTDSRQTMRESTQTKQRTVMHTHAYTVVTHTQQGRI